MIHFRLRRSFRLAVDLLSSNFADTSTAPRSTSFLPGRSRPDISSLFYRAASIALLQWRPSRILSPRPYLAPTALLLALAIEVCGCNPLDSSSYKPGALPNPPLAPDDARLQQTLSFYDPAGPERSLPAPLPRAVADVDARLTPVSAEARPLPWAIPESVYFVYKGLRPDAHSQPHPDELQLHEPPIATAFVLSIPVTGRSHFVRFLVTARHVVDPQWAHCFGQNPASIDLRLNRRSGGVAYESLALRSGAARRFYTPLDSTADLAVIPLDQSLIPDLDDYKFIAVPFRLLLNDAEISLVHADQQVMTARPSERPSGELSNYPVFDGGVLSKMPTDPVSVQCGIGQRSESQARLLHVWFIVAGIPQGVSGAPVYTSIMRTPGAAKTPVLLGIQSVAWPDKGIAGITPSPALGDLIQSALRDSKLNPDFYRGPTP